MNTESLKKQFLYLALRRLSNPLGVSWDAVKNELYGISLAAYEVGGHTFDLYEVWNCSIGLSMEETE